MNDLTKKTCTVKQSFTIFLLFLFAHVNLNAQQGWELGGMLGVSHYYGDLNTSFNLKDPGFAAMAIGRYNFNNRLCLRFGLHYGSVSANDANSENSFERARNLSFKSNLMDGMAAFEFNFLPYIHGSKDQFYTPYLFAGFAFYSFNPTTELDGETYELRNFGTEGQFRGEEYYSVQGALAYGGGIKIALNHDWSINIEASARKLFTDYLDDVSGVYPDMEDLESLRGELAVRLSDRTINGPNIGEIGRQRGNSRDNDTVLYLGVGLVYYFGDIRCPNISGR